MALNHDQVAAQIKHMVAFIQQEAKEKADEIRAKAEEEFNIEKARLVQEERVKIMQQYERRAKQVETEKKIAYSNKLNIARLKLLKEQEEALKSLTEKAKNKLVDVAKDQKKYKDLLKGFLAQALCRLLEPAVDVRVRKADLELVKQVQKDACKQFEDMTGIACTATIVTDDFLPDSCGGGVEVAVGDRIKVVNTLESRLQQATNDILPAIRHMLFGASETRSYFQ